LAIIEKQAQICRRIVGDLLGFSRQIESKMEEMDLNQSIEEVLHLVRHTFKQTGLTSRPIWNRHVTADHRRPGKTQAGMDQPVEQRL
jgi:nitrogen fixation/metabolism regulation signal transduction histidine kinase